MKQFLTVQNVAPFSKASFPILPKSWYLNYLLYQMSLLSLKFRDLNFEFSETSEKILNIQKALNPSKAAGIDDLSGKFLKDGTNILVRPISQLCNLSIKLNSFPRSCKIAKAKPPFKKGSKTNPQNYHPISLLLSYQKLLKGLFMTKHKNF